MVMYSGVSEAVEAIVSGRKGVDLGKQNVKLLSCKQSLHSFLSIVVGTFKLNFVHYFLQFYTLCFIKKDVIFFQMNLF